MRIKALLGGFAAAALAAQPVAAAAVTRAAPSAEGDNAMGGEDGGLLGIGIFIAIVAAFYFIAVQDNDEPISA